MKNTNMSVFIGRFQPPHKAHIDIIQKALNNSDIVLILLGSSFKPRDIRNPFTFQERMEMIVNCFGFSDGNRLRFNFISDHPYNDLAWIKEVQGHISNTHSMNFSWSSDPTDITLIGHHKDHTSYYLDLFPSYKLVEVESIYSLDSTTVRDSFFAGVSSWNSSRKEMSRSIPEGVMNFLDNFIASEETSSEYARLCRERELIRNYKLQWANAPYPPTFVTADAVVTNMGHILLVQRKSAPGEGLWAMPGGFIDQSETVQDCAVRELREETGIKVPEAVLRGSIKREKRYDHPGRSLRGRTITTAFHFDLKDAKMPKVKGSDDAAKAKWIPMNEFIRMQDQMFEDHYSIVTDILGLG